jgi:nitrate reductase delta subunit
MIKSSTLSLRVLARLLAYPDAELRGHLDDMRDALHSEGAVPATRLAELNALMRHLGSGDPLENEAEYVQLFDRGRATSLHLFEHVHGDSRERGPAMIDLTQTYEKAGLFLAPGELPDYLPVLLEFASTQPPKEARALLVEVAHILNAIFSALVKRESAYACVIAALLELAGEKVQAVKVAEDAPLDETWAEPVVFDGCSTQGQAKPGQPQTIHIVRNEKARAATGAAARQGVPS